MINKYIHLLIFSWLRQKKILKTKQRKIKH